MNAHVSYLIFSLSSLHLPLHLIYCSFLPSLILIPILILAHLRPRPLIVTTTPTEEEQNQNLGNIRLNIWDGGTKGKCRVCPSFSLSAVTPIAPHLFTIPPSIPHSIPPFLLCSSMSLPSSPMLLVTTSIFFKKTRPLGTHPRAQAHSVPRTQHVLSTSSILHF